MIHIYYGFGKGKTTCAIGQGMRCYGADMSVLLIQFLKDNKSSELKSIPFEVFEAPKSLSFNPSVDEYKPWVNDALEYAKGSNADVIIFDELLDATCGYVDINDVLDVINSLKGRELIITGHKKIDELFEIADYITHMDKEKHPYDKGVLARKGIEY